MMIIRQKRWGWISGSFLILIAIVAEAMQSHALEGIASEKASNFLTATRFLFFNGLGLIAIHLLKERHPSNMISFAGLFILSGTVLFSFTVLIKIFTSMNGWGWITPLGGVILIVGWILMIISAYRAPY